MADFDRLLANYADLDKKASRTHLCHSRALGSADAHRRRPLGQAAEPAVAKKTLLVFRGDPS